MPASLTACRFRNFRTAAPPSTYMPVFQPHCPASTQLTHTHTLCTPLDRKITLVTRNVGYIDLQVIHTILGRCTLLYIPPGRNLYSPRIKRHGSILVPTPNAIFEDKFIRIWPEYTCSDDQRTTGHQRPRQTRPCAGGDLW